MSNILGAWFHFFHSRIFILFFVSVEKKTHFLQSSSSQSTPGTKRVGSCPHLPIKHFCSSYKVGSSDSVRLWHWLLGGSSVPTDLSCMPRQSDLIQKPAPSPRSLPLFLAKQLSMEFRIIPYVGSSNLLEELAKCWETLAYACQLIKTTTPGLMRVLSMALALRT